MFAYGDTAGGFIGTSGGLFACADINNEAGGWEGWFFQWAFAGAAATIVSGAVAERTKFEAYLIFSFVITVFIYPVVVHWGWGAGWLSAWGAMPDADGNARPLLSGKDTSRGMIDFAGSGIVHMVGGVAGLMGAIVIGPRKGRFTEGIPPSSPQMMALGTMILWFGWYGFNCGSTLMLTAGASNVAAKVAMTTTLAASMGCITMTIIAKVVERNFDIGLALNGILGGLVSITANCSVVTHWHAVLIGMIGAFVCYGASRLLIKLKIDDPLDAFAVHGACGFWGLLATGIFCTDENVAYAAYPNVETCKACSTGEQFGVQVIGAIAIFAWTAAMSGALFLAIKFTIGIRVAEDVEDLGMDVSEHGAPSTTNGIFPMESTSDVKTVSAEP
jgi:Amt family ammonium transporter